MSDLSYLNDRALCDLLPSVGFHLGVSGCDMDKIGLPDAQHYVVLLVDGLGWDITMRSLADVPYISSVIGEACKITACMPTTTAASLTSLWTGSRPGTTGIFGFSFRRSQRGKESTFATTPLFADDPIPTAPSMLDRCVGDGIKVTCVVPQEHIGSGFTRMGTTMSAMVGVDIGDTSKKVTAISDATRGGRTLVYTYDPRLDHAGHGHGVASKLWRRTLQQIDSDMEALRESLDDDVCLIVTGDHGMVDVARTDKIVIDDDPDLAANLVLVGGEARFRHLYTRHPSAVAERWHQRFGDQAWVMTREQAIDEEIFGPVKDEYVSRIGDVLVVARGGQAWLTRSFMGEFSLVGMHGAGTSAERYVPVLID